MSIEQLASWAKELGLGKYADEICKSAVPCVHLRTSDQPGRGAVGQSRFGGVPDLPESIEWPRRGETPLYLVAQIRLSELAGLPVAPGLPSEGMLYFFYNIEDSPCGDMLEDRDGWRVIYYADESAVKRRDAVTEESEMLLNHLGGYQFYGVDVDHFEGVVVEARTVVSIPGDRSTICERMELDDSIVVDELEAYIQLMGSCGKGELLPNYWSSEGWHQMFGFPHADQGDDMEVHREFMEHGIRFDEDGWNDPRRPALEEKAKDWILLLQVDSDPNARIQWGGKLYCWIRRQDLARADFSNVWMTLQCG